jgi:hypothetical protein
VEGHDTITISGKYKIDVNVLGTICLIISILLIFVPELLPIEIGLIGIISLSLGLFFLGCSVYLFNVSKKNKITKSDYIISIGFIIITTIATIFVIILVLNGGLENNSWFWYLIFFIWFIVFMETYPIISRYKEIKRY